MAEGARLPWLLDANVFFDYLEAEPRILDLANRHLGTIHVLTATLEEIDDQSVSELLQHGFVVKEATGAQKDEAKDIHRDAPQGNRQPSRHDCLCLVVAHEEGFVCVTSDRRLREACQARDVPTLWGLEVMLLLVRGGWLQAEETIPIAWAVRRRGNRISRAVVEDFVRAVQDEADRTGTA